MTHKLIFIVASVMIFFALDQNWLYPLLLGKMPLIFGWVTASVLAGFQLIALIAEWSYLD
jgi:hypothetical protein